MIFSTVFVNESKRKVLLILIKMHWMFKTIFPHS